MREVLMQEREKLGLTREEVANKLGFADMQHFHRLRSRY